MLVKVAPDLADGDIDTIVDLALGLDVDGIIATNTTTSRDSLHDPAAVEAADPGGHGPAPRGRLPPWRSSAASPPAPATT